MKKMASLILVLAMLVSVTACKGKAEKESHLEEASANSSETATAVSETATSESETSATDTLGKKNKIAPEGLITRDLTAFHLDTEEKEDHFELTSFDDSNQDFNTHYKYDRLVVVEDDFAYLQEAIDKIQNQYIDDMLSRYEETCEILKTDPSVYTDTSIYQEPVIVIPSYDIISWPNRVDSLVTSFQIMTTYGSLDWDTYNISSKDGRLLTLDDVVTDKQSFEKLVIEGHYPLTVDYGVEYKEYMEADKKAIHDSIENNTLRFVMYYDGLQILIPAPDFDGESPLPPKQDKIFISSFRYPDIFNMDFFTHVPEYYSLQYNYSLMGKTDIVWDFDGDGLTEVLFMELGEKSYCTQATLHYEDSSIDLEIANCDEEYLTFLQADDGKYIYTDTYCVRIESDGSLKMVSTVLGETGWMLSSLRHGQTPDHVIRECYGDIGGSQNLKRDYTLLGTEGKTRPLTTYYFDDNPELGGSPEVGTGGSLVDVPAVLYDKDTGEDGEETVIPQGSKYVFCEYDSWKHMVLFCITPPGEETHDKDYYAKVEFIPYSHIGDLPRSGGRFADIPDDEIFAGLIHLN
ncbi:MAG: hypothetical protein IK106_06365 [Clostridiales bacterium]|nr:hypothetical protein [Clostridiales bacterium]